MKLIIVGCILGSAVIGVGIYHVIKRRRIRRKVKAWVDSLSSDPDSDEDLDIYEEYEDLEDRTGDGYEENPDTWFTYDFDTSWDSNWHDDFEDCCNPDVPLSPLTLEDYEEYKRKAHEEWLAKKEAEEKAMDDILAANKPLDMSDALDKMNYNNTSHIEDEVDYIENLIDYEVFHSYVPAVTNPRVLPRPDIMTTEKPVYVTYFRDNDAYVEMGFKAPRIPISRIISELDTDESDYFENMANNGIFDFLVWTFSGDEVKDRLDVDRCIEVYVKVIDVGIKDINYYRIDSTGKFYESMVNRAYNG